MISENGSRFSSWDPVFIIPPFHTRSRSLDSLITEKIQSKLPEFNSGGGVLSLDVEIPSPLTIKLNNQIYPLRNVITGIRIAPKTDSVRALFNVCSRLSDTKTIALTSTCNVRIKGRQMVFVTIVKDDNNEKGTMSMKIHYYDDAGKETTLPEGIVMGLSYQ